MSPAAAALTTSQPRWRRPMALKTGDYEVGYGKPPRHTRFKKGQSGNLRGRPSGSKNLSTLVIEALNQLVVVAENGGRRKITKRQAIITQLVNQSAKAHWRATQIRLQILQAIEAHTQPASPQTSFDAAARRLIGPIRTR